MTCSVDGNTYQTGFGKFVIPVNNEVTGKDDASVFVTRDDASCTKLPDRLPETGPMTIATGAVGAGAVTTILGYYVASRKK